MTRDRYADAVAWIEQALCKPGADRHPSLCVRALGIKSWALWPIGRGTEQRAVMTQARAIAEALPDAAPLSAILAYGAVQESWNSDFELASTLADEATTYATMSGDPWTIAMAAWARALATSSAVDLGERVEHAATLLKEAGNAYHFADVYFVAGHRALNAGSDRQALEFYRPRDTARARTRHLRMSGCSCAATSERPHY